MLQSIPSTNMFLPLRGSETSLRHSTSIGISITLKPSATSLSWVSLYAAAIFASSWVRHMLSSRMVQPGFNSPALTRPSSTCSLNATTRAASSPPLVTRREPMRMRLPLAPATLRAGGWISAGMISTVQTPLPMRAAIEPNDWPHFCAPSPESLMISMTLSSSVTTCLASAPEEGDRVSVARGRRAVTAFMVLPRQADARVAALRAVDAEQSRDRPCRPVLVDRIGVAQAEERVHSSCRTAPRAQRFDDRRRPGDDVAARKHARDRRRKVLVGGDVST